MAGYLKSEKVRQGSAGVTVKLRDYIYFKRDGNTGTVFPIASVTEYRSEVSGGSDPITTKFTYGWHTTTCQVQEKTTILPPVPSDEHGANAEDSQHVRSPLADRQTPLPRFD